MITTCPKCGRQWEFATHFVGIQECPHCHGTGNPTNGYLPTITTIKGTTPTESDTTEREE